MSEIYRCSNCGQRIREPGDPCSACGYEGRSHHGTGETRFWVILKNWGPQADQLREVLRRLYRVPDAILQEQELPVILHEGNDKGSVHELEVTIRQHGGEVEIVTDEESIGPLGSDTHQENRPQNRSGRVFSIIVFLAMVVGSILSQHSEALREWLESWSGRIKPEKMHQEDPFAQIQIIVCVKDIAPGETITEEKLGVIALPRDQVPENSFCPRDVGNLIGRRSVSGIDRGVIIQGSMIDQ